MSKEKTVLAKAFNWLVNHFVAFTLMCTLTVGAFWSTGAVPLRDYLDHVIEEKGGTACTYVPPTGHRVEGAEPGEFGRVYWRGVERLRDNCGAPHVIGVISNGGGFLHDSPLSIGGLPMQSGVYNLSYLFYINPSVEPGPARFRVIVTYPEAVGGAPPTYTPWLEFTIREQSGGIE